MIFPYFSITNIQVLPSQSTFLLLAHKQPYLVSSNGTSFVPCGPSCICVHLSWGFLSSIKQMILSYTAGNKPIDYATCNVCNTDYKLQLIECNEYDLTLVITRWITLGPGLSRDDPQWTDHKYESLIRYSFSMDTRIPSISPRSVFEAAVAKDWSVEALCSYNLSFLRNRQYKILMQRKCFLCDTIWFLSPQKHMERQGISIPQ